MTYEERLHWILGMYYNFGLSNEYLLAQETSAFLNGKKFDPLSSTLYQFQIPVSCVELLDFY